MPGYEQSGGKTRVAERTALLAAEHGKDAALRAQRFLDAHVAAGRITKEEMQSIMDADSAAAEAVFTEERNLGQHNDSESMRTGVKVLMTEHGKSRIEELMRIREVPAGDLLAPRFTSIISTTDPEVGVLYQMDLPLGTFSARDSEFRTSRISFFTEGHEIGSDSAIPRGVELSTFAFEVLRIEGSAGELWQNPGYVGYEFPIPQDPSL